MRSVDLTLTIHTIYFNVFVVRSSVNYFQGMNYSEALLRPTIQEARLNSQKKKWVERTKQRHRRT